MVFEIGNATQPCSERVTLVCRNDKHHLVVVAVVELFLDSLCRIESKIGFKTSMMSCAGKCGKIDLVSVGNKN
jgi:hypothetical protein